MEFSVIIPLYNKEAYILRAINSVLTQSYANFELIVIDDGSTDDGANLVRAIKNPILRLVHQANGGASAARNSGIREATKPYIAFLDADDAWSRNHLENLAALIKDYPNAGLYCTGYYLTEASGKIKRPNWFNVPARGYIEQYFLSASKGDLIATSSSVCIPAHVFDDVGGFPVGEKLGEDQDMWARAALKYMIAVDSVPTATYFRNAINRVCVTEKHEGELPYLARLQSHLDRGRYSDQMSNDIRAYIRQGLYTIISLNLRNGQLETARRLLQDPRLRNLELRLIVWTMLAMLPAKLTAAALRLGDLMREVVHGKTSGSQ